MSKAFTKESDDSPEVPEIWPKASVLPPGAPNFLTEKGARRLQAELAALWDGRSQLLALTDDDERKRRLKVVDQRSHHLQASLQSAGVVSFSKHADGEIRFGATVTVRRKSGDETKYRIVGIDETDFDEISVNWISPIAQSLLGAHLGERVLFAFPSGQEDLEIVEVEYE